MLKPGLSASGRFELLRESRESTGMPATRKLSNACVQVATARFNPSWLIRAIQRFCYLDHSIRSEIGAVSFQKAHAKDI
jgi:hypothetical protein